MTTARDDYGSQLLRGAIKLRASCEFQTRRSRMIRGIPVFYDDTMAKVYIEEITGGKKSITEILRGDIGHITYPAEVLEQVGAWQPIKGKPFRDYKAPPEKKS